MARPREKIEDKFWSKVIKGINENDCCQWNASKFKAGYGQLTHGSFVNERKNLKAHRVSYELHFGPIPVDKIVCHTCDNRECTNPKHLFLGTWQDNVQDMIKKGRKADTSGELNGKAKLTRETVEKIREDYLLNDPDLSRYHRKKYSQAILGKMYGISQTVVCDIVRGNYWK